MISLFVASFCLFSGVYAYSTNQFMASICIAFSMLNFGFAIRCFIYGAIQRIDA